MKLRYFLSLYITVISLMSSCSSTSNLPAGEQLYVGLKPIDFRDYEQSAHATSTMEEIEAALATAPSGSLFGSSYYRSPFPFRLWAWNAFSGSKTTVGKWLNKTFAKQPLLLSQVGAPLRESVAEEVLVENGYFHGQVDHKEVSMRNERKAKIAYTVSMGQLFTIDSLAYVNFPANADSLINSKASETLIHKNDPFSAANLEAERNRIALLLRNNGYYHYSPSYSSYLADTLTTPGKVLLWLQMTDGVPDVAMRQWKIGKIDVNLRKRMMERLTDSLSRRRFTVHYTGRRSPIRPRVIMRDLKLRSGSLYSYDNYLESMNKLSATGLFSMIDFKFIPSDTVSTIGTLDLQLNCVFDKRYDFYIESNLKGKTNGLYGPGLVLGFNKRNAFRGGETLTLDVWGNYEWQTGHKHQNTSSRVNTYEYGVSASVEYPRLLLPGIRLRKRFFTTPSTILNLSTNVQNRGSYFKRHIISGEWTYRFQLSERSIHEFTPLSVQYDRMASETEEFRRLRAENPYLDISMRDQFIPKMRYTYTLTSPSSYRHPVYWRTSVSEAGNILSVGYLAAGKKFSEKEKTMFKNPFAQFLKVETDFRKTWSLTAKSSLVAHAAAGILYAFGNSTVAPYNEQFYVGGANSIRAFNIRSIGPGNYVAPNEQLSYMDQTGDMKLLFNLEYRFPLWGNLYGAAFIDAGNVWGIHSDDYREGAKFRLKNLPRQMATGTGLGLRYDLDYFVVRLDWGWGLHLPYSTSKSGYFNIPSFRDAQSIHLAIGYPF